MKRGGRLFILRASNRFLTDPALMPCTNCLLMLLLLASCALFKPPENLCLKRGASVARMNGTGLRSHLPLLDASRGRSLSGTR